MKAEKKITIKVKSKADHRDIADPEVEMISEWNIKRILSAVLALLILIIIPAYYLTHLDDNDSLKNTTSAPPKNESTIVQSDSINEIIPEETVMQDSSEEMVAEKPLVEISPSKSTEQADKETVSEEIIDSTQKELQEESKEIIQTPLNKYITQARLARWVANKEPHGQVELPLFVGRDKAEGFYYFTDVNDMKGSTLFHEWLREGQSIYKRKFIIKGNRARMSTSKLFTFRSTGQWQVRIITQQGEILHKIDFSVEKR